LYTSVKEHSSHME